MVLLGILVGILIGIAIVRMSDRIRKSEYYKQVLSDLFVAGRIRQIAESKAIDLGQEYEDFKSFNKKMSIYRVSLDERIEEELADEITNDQKLFEEQIKETPEAPSDK